MEQYTKETCSEFSAVFDRLIQGLVRAGESANEMSKLDLLHQAVAELNALNEKDGSLIEAGEREDLCELVNRVTTACDLDPAKYGEGEGPASEWRGW